MTSSVDCQPSWMGKSGPENRIPQKPRRQRTSCVALSGGADQLWPDSHPRRIMPRPQQNVQLQPGPGRAENVLNRLVAEERLGEPM